MTGRSGGRGTTDERGTAAVEMALVLPMVATLMFGFIDLGRAYRLKTSLANAAHEGAAYARFNPTRVDGGGACSDPDNVVYVTRNEEATPQPFTVTVRYTTQSTETPTTTWTPVSGCDSTADPARVAVTASSRFKVMTPLVSGIVGHTITLQETSEVLVP